MVATIPAVQIIRNKKIKKILKMYVYGYRRYQIQVTILKIFKMAGILKMMFRILTIFLVRFGP